VAVEDGGVVMVAFGLWQKNVNLESLCGYREAVRECVVRRVVGSQEILPLRAATRDLVELFAQNLAWT
jgi:Na+-transporting NADH:ubiquinone oxidoreductase subunit NqrF